MNYTRPIHRTTTARDGLFLHAIRCIVATVLVTLCLGAAMAGETPILSVEAEGLAPIVDGDVKSAKNLAILLARLQAIRDGVCRDISTESLMVSLRLSGGLAGSIPYCKIIENNVLADGPDNGAAGTTKKGAWPIYRHKIQASVVEVKSPADSKFRIDAYLNHARFQEGEEMEVRIIPTMSCYFYIYIILENGRIAQLLPNRYITHKRVDAGQMLIFPEAKAHEGGITLTTQLPHGKKVTTEMVYVVALKASARPATIKLEGPTGTPNEGAAGNFDQLVAKIATIPANQRSEMILPYQIVEKKP